MLDQHDGTNLVPTQTHLTQSGLKRAEELGIERAEIEALAEDINAQVVPTDIADLETHLSEAGARLRDQKDAALSLLKRQTQIRVEGLQAFQQCQWEHALTRDAIRPNVTATLLISYLFFSMEALAKAAVMSAGGLMSPEAALLFGAIFAFINVLLAQLMGYFGLRYLRYRQRDTLEEENAIPRKLRRFGLIFLLGAGAILTNLIFVAARVRVTGSHEDIYSFTEVSFLATFNNGFSLIIIAIAFASTVVGIQKGYSGYGDSNPEIEARAKAIERTDQDAEQSANLNMDQIEGAALKVCEIAEQQTHEIRGISQTLEASAQELNHLSKVQNAKCETSCLKELSRLESLSTGRQFVGGAPISSPEGVRAVFDALRVDEEAFSDVNAKVEHAKGLVVRAEAALSQFEAQCDAAITEIEGELSQYFATEPVLDRTRIH